jgi:hypothetical protein
MVYFAFTQAQAEEVAPPTSREGGQAEATVTKPLSASPLLTAIGVNKMYHQLAEIHTIAATQLAECAHWRQSDSTPSLVRATTGQVRLIMTQSTMRLAPPPPIDFFHPRPRYGGKVGVASPRLTARLARVARVRCPSTTLRACDRTNMMTSSGKRSRSHTTSPPSAPPTMRRSCFALPREAGRRP